MSAKITGRTNKKTGSFRRRFSVSGGRNTLYNGNPSGPGALLAFLYLKLYLCAFRKRFETLGDDGRVMHEHLASVTGGDETKTLLVVEPLYCTLCH
jgi:hypothetical protein